MRSGSIVVIRPMLEDKRIYVDLDRTCSMGTPISHTLRYGRVSAGLAKPRHVERSEDRNIFFATILHTTNSPLMHQAQIPV